MTYVSPGFEELTGYAADEVLGRPCSLLQGPGTDPDAIASFRQALGDGRETYVTLLNYRKDGSTFWNEVALAPQRDDTGRVVRYLGVQKDVSDRLQTEARIHQLAYTDSLTGLNNREAFTEHLGQALSQAQEHAHELAILFLDLDDFKRINDTYGHGTGDRLLRTVADRLRAACGADATIARTGGDEFLILLSAASAIRQNARDVAARAARSLVDPFAIAGEGSASIRASIGISTYPEDAETIEELLKHADAAMYSAKATGKNRLMLYRSEHHKTGYRHDPDFDPVAARPELARILSARDITPVFQPIVTLSTGAVIGYEALARGPEGSELQRPDRLFATAQAAGRVQELDWLCRIRAVESALDAGLGRRAALFLNCEPSTIDAPCPAADLPVWQRAQSELELVLEITERAVTDRPAELSRMVKEHRDIGCGVALDDLGADVRSLALLPFIEPDVVKLDLRLVQDRPSTEQAAIVSSVAAERERTGAAVVAEGIETEEHLAVARSLGATLGQGFYWGRPGPLPELPSSGWRRPIALRSEQLGRTPFEVIAPHGPVAEASKRLLLPMSHHLEDQALRIGEGAVVLAAFQDARHFTPRTSERYATLAASSSFVAALGVGLSSSPVIDVRGADIDSDDPLAGEWSILVVGPHFAGALVAQDLGDSGVESDRRFRYTTTYRRDLVIAAARTLLERIVPVPAASPALTATPA